MFTLDRTFSRHATPRHGSPNTFLTYHRNFLRVAGRLSDILSCTLVYSLQYFWQASLMVSLSLAFVITGLTRTVFVRTRSIHIMLVPPQLDLQEASLLTTLVSGKTRMSHLLALDILLLRLRRGCSGCNPAKTPLRPRTGTWIRGRRPNPLVYHRFRRRFTSTVIRTLRFCSPRHPAVCSCFVLATRRETPINALSRQSLCPTQKRMG